MHLNAEIKLQNLHSKMQILQLYPQVPEEHGEEQSHIPHCNLLKLSRRHHKYR